MKTWVYIILAIVITTAAQGISLTAKWDPNTRSDIIVGYIGNGTTPPTRARVFALRINAEGGIILSVRGYSARGGGGYNIYPGSIVVDPNTGIVKSYGTPVESDNRYGMGRSALGSDQIIVVMCSLYQDSANIPATEGNLFTITMDKYCTVTVTPETVYRDGVVSEDGDAMSVDPVTLWQIANCSRRPDTGTVFPDFTPNNTGVQTVYNGWMTPIKPTSRYFDAPSLDNLCASIMCLTPAQHAVVANWLSTSTIADYNGDKICSPRDWALACRVDFLAKGIVWGKDEKSLTENLRIYIAEAYKREAHVAPNSRAHRNLVRIRSDWIKTYNDTTAAIRNAKID